MVAAPGVHLPAQEAELRREDARRGGEGRDGSRGEVCALGGEEGGEGGGEGGWGGAGAADDGGAVGVGRGREGDGDGDGGSGRRGEGWECVGGERR